MHRFSPICRVVLPVAAVLVTSCSKPLEPDVAVRTVIQEITQGRASSIWRALPTSYKREVAAAFQGFAAKLDPQVYDRGFALARRLLAILRQTPGSISEAMPAQLAGAPIDEHADTVLNLFDELTTSQFASVAGVENLDIEVCLDSLGRALIDTIGGIAVTKDKDVDALLRSIQVEVQSRDQDGLSCVLKLSSTITPMSFAVPFQQVEGKWLPRSMVQGWQRSMDQMRSGIAEMPSMRDAANKKRMLGELERFERQLDKLKAASSMGELGELMQQMARPPR